MSSHAKNNIKFKSALAAAKGLNGLINLVAKGRGTGLPGEKALKIDPRMVEHFTNIDPEKVIFITGTNGKSTTTNLVTHILRYNGKKVISNLEGANMLDGIATALSRASDLSGRVEADYFVFEVDERFMPIIYDQLPAGNMLIMNLMKDQVQRNGEPQFIIDKIAQVMHPDIRLFLNNDEPKTKAFEKFSEHTVYFNAEENAGSFMKDESYPTQSCPVCDHKIEFDYYTTDGIGRFHCSHCGFSSCPKADYTVRDADYENKTFTINGVTMPMPYAQPYMLYNYAGAAAICKEIAGIDEEGISKALENFENIQGRDETIDYHGKKIKFLRIKQENPDTLQNTLNAIANDPAKKTILLGLYLVDDFVPAYDNALYLYDCDWSGITGEDVESYYVFSPVAAYDAALRLRYEGVPDDKITIDDSGDLEKILAHIDQSEAETVYLISWLGDFVKLRELIEKKEKEA